MHSANRHTVSFRCFRFNQFHIFLCIHCRLHCSLVLFIWHITINAKQILNAFLHIFRFRTAVHGQANTINTINKWTNNIKLIFKNLFIRQTAWTPMKTIEKPLANGHTSENVAKHRWYGADVQLHWSFFETRIRARLTHKMHSRLVNNDNGIRKTADKWAEGYVKRIANFHFTRHLMRGVRSVSFTTGPMDYVSDEQAKRIKEDGTVVIAS